MRCLREALDETRKIVEEGTLMKMDAEQLRELVQNNNQTDPGLEADQYRFGDEVGDEAQSQERSKHQDGPHQ